MPELESTSGVKRFLPPVIDVEGVFTGERGLMLRHVEEAIVYGRLLGLKSFLLKSLVRISVTDLAEPIGKSFPLSLLPSRHWLGRRQLVELHTLTAWLELASDETTFTSALLRGPSSEVKRHASFAVSESFL